MINDNLARSAKLSYELRATSYELLLCTRGRIIIRPAITPKGTCSL